MPHATPIIDKLGLTHIAREFSKYRILKKLKEVIERGQRWIPKTRDTCLKLFDQIVLDNHFN